MEQTTYNYDEQEEIRNLLKTGPETVMVESGLFAALEGTLGGIISARSIKRLTDNNGGALGLVIGTLCIGSSIRNGINCFKVAKYLHEKHIATKLGKNASKVRDILFEGKENAKDAEFEVKES